MSDGYIWSGGSEVANNASGASSISGYMSGYLIAAKDYESVEPFARVFRAYGTNVETEDFVVESGGTIYANNGTYTNLTINGKGNVTISSSHINGAVVSGYFASSGATIYSANLLMHKNMTGENITVYSGAKLTVSVNTTASNVTFYGNKIKWYAADWAMALGEVSGGGLLKDGVAYDATRVIVRSGGTAENMEFHTSTHFYVMGNGLISGGKVHCANLEVRGGTVRGTVVDSGGALLFTRVANGKTIDVTIGSGGLARINSNAGMTNTLISGGAGTAVVHVSSGAAVSTTIMSKGSMIVSKLSWYTPAVTSTTLTEGGSMEVYGVASDTVADNWGRMNVRSGGTALGVTLDDGGKTYLYSGASADNATANANGYFYLYSGAVATNIVENGGFAWGQKGATLTFVANSFSDVDLRSNATLHSVTTGTNIGIRGSDGNVMSCIFFGGTGYNLEAHSGGIIYTLSGHVSGAVVHSGGLIDLAVNNSITFMSGAFVESGGSMNMRGGIVQDVTVSGAMVGDDEDKTLTGVANLTMYNGTLDGLNVSGIAGCYGTNAHADTTKRIAAVISGGSVTNVNIQDAGYVTVSNAGVTDVTMSRAANTAVSAWCWVNNVHSNMNTRLQVYSNGLATNVNVLGTGQCECFVQAGGVVSNINISGRGYFGAYAGGTILGGVGSGTGAELQGRGGMISGVTLFDRGQMIVSLGTVRGNNHITGAYLKVYGSKGNIGIADKAFISGGLTKTTSAGKEKWTYVAAADVSSGGKLTNAFVGDGTQIVVRTSGSVIDAGVLGLNTYDANTQDQNVMARVLVSGGGLWQGGDVLKHAQCILYTGGSASGVTLGSGAHVYVSANATATDMILDGGLDFGIRGGTAENTLIKKGRMTVSSGVASETIISGGSFQTLTNGTADDTVMRGGLMSIGAGTLNRTTVSGGYLYVYSAATLNDTVLSSGGSMRIFMSGGAVVNGLTTEAGANLVFDFTSGAAVGAMNIDSLENVNAPVTVVNYSTDNTYTLATVGNEDLEVNISYQGIYGKFGAGESYLNPLYYGRAFTLDAEGKTLEVASQNMSGTILTTEAADLATSGAFLTGYVNSSDKALMWLNVNLDHAVTFATSAANIAGDAWIDLDRTKGSAGATIYGAEGDCMSDGKVLFLIHGSGSVGNFAGGATAGGVVGGVELVGYNTTYGQTYLGGMGTVANLVSARVSSGNTLAKDFYAGALANYAKTGIVTSVGGIDTTIALNTSAGTSKETKYYAKGNIYGASQVKAGDVTTAATVHSVGDVVLTVNNGETTNDTICIFAAGYATGSDAAKTLPVYTVNSVTATIAGGNWGGAHGGRGVFGGAFAGDNTAAGDAGVWAKVGNVNLKVSGGTMGNVYGGGWAQKGALSEVGNVNLTISGGTIANVFGGGSHSTSGGTTKAGDITITVSGGAISNAIYARGQLDGDATGAASVIFTGAKNFSCGVYGYSYVSGATGTEDDVSLSFTSYAGTFSGAIGGFNGITFDGNTTMTLGTAAADVSNTAWTFDTAERFTALARSAFLEWGDSWNVADFAGDTIAINLATGNVTEWDLVKATPATTYGKFDVLVNGTSILSETLDLDQKIASGDYKNWGFTVEDSVLKFKNLA